MESENKDFFRKIEQIILHETNLGGFSIQWLKALQQVASDNQAGHYDAHHAH